MTTLASLPIIQQVCDESAPGQPLLQQLEPWAHAFIKLPMHSSRQTRQLLCDNFSTAKGLIPNLMFRSPKTGQRLRHGPALRERAVTVELPAVTALFADIVSRNPQRPWDLNPNPGAAQQMPPPPLVGMRLCSCCDAALRAHV